MNRILLITILSLVLAACSSPKRADEVTNTNRTPYHDQEVYQLEQLGYGPHNPDLDIAKARRIRDQNLEASEPKSDSWLVVLIKLIF